MTRVIPILSSGRSTPMVSVVIPTYRRWGLLCDAIESVMKQSFSMWEIIVVNDCGGKPEGKAIELLSDPRVKYLEHELNQGLPAARNTGLSASQGKYIAYLDDDDVYYENHLDILVAALEDNNWEVGYTLANEASYKLTESSRQLVNKEEKFNRPFDRRLLWKENYIPVNCVMHRRDCILNTGNFDASLPLLEDWDLWLRMSLKYDFHMLSTVTCEFRVRDEKSSMTTTATLDKWWKVKCTIYFKYLQDQDVICDNVSRQLLTGGISHFVRKNISWFGSAFSGTAPTPVLIDLLKHVYPETWLKMFVKSPLQSVKLAGRFINGCGRNKEMK